MYEMDLQSHAVRPSTSRSKLKSWCRDLYLTSNAASSAVGKRTRPTRLAPHRSCFRCIPLRQSTAVPGSDMASQAALILCYEYTFDDVYTFYRACRSLRRILNGLEESYHTVKIPLDSQGAMSPMALPRLLRGVVQ